ncbi:hypothetical protein [Verrucosispora sp. TAA-831]|uniref:hypothetical protein n=1 Tax=Verrucosispora sp. TAA-831 TaxID=3422227 RepID=UPI003D6E2C79
MSRQELAEFVAAYLFKHTGRTVNIDGRYVGKLERGEHRWPTEPYRTAFRAVLGRDTDAALGFFVIQGHANDAARFDPKSSHEADDADQVASEVGAGAVRVNVSAEAGSAVTVVCQDGTAGRVAVVACGVRVLIDASGAGGANLTPTVFDFPAMPDGARVYSLAERRA